MVEPKEQRDPTRHYEAVERAYCEDRWQDVLQDGRALLEELEGSEDPLAMALRLRVQLLQAHALLHGLGDRDGAEDLYRAVLASRDTEPALRQSAQQGLQQCDLPIFRQPLGEEEAEPAEAPEPGSLKRGVEKDREPVAAPEPERSGSTPPPAESPQPGPIQAGLPDWAGSGAPPQRAGGVAAGSHAMPWLTQPPGAEEEPTATADPAPAAAADPVPAVLREPLIAEVVEEPEQIEVHQADASLAQAVDLTEATSDPAAPEAPTGTVTEPHDGSGEAVAAAGRREAELAAWQGLEADGAIPARAPEPEPVAPPLATVAEETVPQQTSPQETLAVETGAPAQPFPEGLDAPPRAWTVIEAGEGPQEQEGIGEDVPGDGVPPRLDEAPTAARPEEAGEAAEPGEEAEEEDPELLRGLLRVVLR